MTSQLTARAEERETEKKFSKQLDSASKRLGLTLIALGLFWACAFVSIVYPQLPPNATSTPLADQMRMLMLQVAPQGWAFFTRSPREPRVLAWGKGSAGWTPVTQGPHSEARNAFGFNRASRAQGVETGVLLEQVPNEAWRDCPDGNVGVCLARLTPRIKTRNPGPTTTLCGEVTLVQQEPLPWAWFDPDAETTPMPAQVLPLDVTC